MVLISAPHQNTSVQDLRAATSAINIKKYLKHVEWLGL